MTEKRFHPFAVLHLLRKTILVYLLPLVQVLFARNRAALWAALAQDVLLLALLSMVCWEVLRVSGWQMDAHGNLLVRWRLGIRLDRTLRADMLAALTIDRPVVYRLAGASRLTLYPAGQKKPLTLIVARDDARELADRLLPLEQPVVHRPHGGEKMVFAVLGANGLSTLALMVLALRQSRPYAPDAQTLAFAWNFLLILFHQEKKKRRADIMKYFLRKIVSVSLASLIVIGSACAFLPSYAHAATSSDTITLRVCNWEEYIDEGDWDETIDLESGDIKGENSMVADFEDWYYKTYGKKVKVEYSCLGTNEELYNMLTLGDEYDLVCPSEYMIMKLMSEDRLEPFSNDFYDKNIKENYYSRGVSPFIKNMFDSNEINGEAWSRYAAGYMWGITG